MLCPNCGHELDPDVSLCANCGSLVYPQVQPERVIKSTGWDIGFGVLLSLVLFLIGGIGFVVNPILYFLYRKKFPSFARGIGIATVIPYILALVALGLFATCMVIIRTEKG